MPLRLILPALVLALLLLPAPALAQDISISLGEDGSLATRSIQLILLVTLLSLVPGLAIAAILAWTAFFAWANWPAIVAASPQSAIDLVGAWAPAVVVVGIVWLVALRTSRPKLIVFVATVMILMLMVLWMQNLVVVMKKWFVMLMVKKKL